MDYIRGCCALITELSLKKVWNIINLQVSKFFGIQICYMTREYNKIWAELLYFCQNWIIIIRFVITDHWRFGLKMKMWLCSFCLVQFMHLGNWLCFSAEELLDRRSSKDISYFAQMVPRLLCAFSSLNVRWSLIQYSRM